MLKQHQELSIFVRRTVENNKERANREREFDAADFHTVIPCATKSAIEAQFQHVYTHKKFKEVQVQFREKVNCITRSMHSTLGFITYEVVEQGHTVPPFSERLKLERVDKVAPKYILERWSKNIKRRYTHIKSSQVKPILEPRSKRFNDLVFWSHNICKFASESE
ncbi:hypothetical protein Ahy_B01g056695 [Arachis hypogaea]|uniref:Protein FAR1-RELATED SEQUENCE n=1 Tax=Arachis hypogaea TaxID=3818 RepID=A0A445AZD3_ARAHY|nr:hypothetical protein Ahy_B01g056695 [Arachis hypogaea]